MLTGPQVSVALGIGILLAVLANRIATPELVDSQARTDILGVIASGGLLTNGVYLLVRVRHGHKQSHTATAVKALCFKELRGYIVPVCDVDSAEHLVASSPTLLHVRGGLFHVSSVGCMHFRRARADGRRAALCPDNGGV